ncbi:MAG: hypothetical protein ACYCX2_04710 [Christensenellales bacterium]
MEKRKLYDKNLGLKVSGAGLLLCGALLVFGIWAGWMLITVLLSLVAAVLLTWFIRDAMKLLKVKRMTDEEYAGFIDRERELFIANAVLGKAMRRPGKKGK